MLRLLFIALITFTLVKLTTFGWQGFYRRREFRLEDKALPERLREHVIKLSDNIGDRTVFRYAKLREAADYISREFSEMGLKLEFQKYSVDGKEVKNIIAHSPGGEKAAEIIIVGAHYDTCFNPGANDNASGIAALLELARFFSAKESSRTIRFIAFVNEEPPFFRTEAMGSFVYAKRAREEGEDIKAVIILETIGYYSDKPFSQRYPLFLGPFFPNRADFIAVVGNLTNRKLVRALRRGFSAHSDFPIASVALFDFVPGVDFSDHWSFWQQDFPAVMVTDTAFYRYAHYHAHSDTYEKLDYRSLAAVTQGLSHALLGLSK